MAFEDFIKEVKKVNKERTPTSDALSSPINICPLNQ